MTERSLKSRGGKRHLAKPTADAGLVYKALSANEDFVKDLGAYEVLSRNAGVDYKSLVANIDLIKALVKVERSGEIHSQPLRSALTKMLVDSPELNKTKWNGEVWVNLKGERITCLMYHFRKVARDALEDGLKIAAVKLKPAEFIQLKEVVGMVELRDLDGADNFEKSATTSEVGRGTVQYGSDAEATLEKGTPYDDKTLEKGDYSKTRKQLQRNISDVSMDSQGFPKMLGSPSPEPERSSHTPRFTPGRPRRISAAAASSSSWEAPQDKELRDALGFLVDEEGVEAEGKMTGKPLNKGLDKGPSKKNAAGKRKALKKGSEKKTGAKKGHLKKAGQQGALKKGGAKKGDKSALKKGGAKKGDKSASKKGDAKKGVKDKCKKGGRRKKWYGLYKTVAKKGNKRSYVCGIAHAGAAKSLIVEVTKTRSSMHEQIVDRIMKSLKEDHITKDEALQMRERLCAEYP